MEVFHNLGRLFRQHWPAYVVGIALLVVVDLAQLITPRLLGQIADGLEAGTLDTADLRHYALLIIGIALAIAGGRYLWRTQLLGTARRMEYILRNEMYAHLTSLEPAFFDRHPTGDLMARATNDLEAVRMSLGMGAVMLTDAVVLTLSTLIVVVTTIDPYLTLAALAPFPFMVASSISLGRVIHANFAKAQAAFSRLTDFTQENLTQIRVIKAFAREDYQVARFNDINNLNLQTNVRLARYSSLLYPLLQFLATVSLVITLFYGGGRVLQGTLTLGDFVAFNSYLGLLVWPVMAVGWVINIIQRGTASLARINAVLDHQAQITTIGEPAVPEHVEGHISIRGLSFTYPEAKKPALQNCNLEIAAGQFVGIIGPTGSGKSTLLQLILRLYDPPPQSIFIDGVDVRRWPLAALRESIGYVPQESFLFFNTIAENIAFATSISPQVIAAATRDAGLAPDLASLPQGLATPVGSKGVTLSGGQKQRVSLARALAKDPPILLLDDCLSAVDTQTQNDILENLRRWRGRKTIVLITHRVSMVQEADQVIALEQGRVSETGTPAELEYSHGYYWRLRQQQLLEEKRAGLGRYS